MLRKIALTGAAAIALASVFTLDPLALAQPGGQPGGQPGNQQNQGFPDLGRGLMATEGCLGVDFAQTQSGKNVIFAWFEDKAAVKRWYYSDTHTQAMRMINADPSQREPLEHVEDGAGPIMVVASLVFDENAEAVDNMGVSQIAIELYQPLPGGAYVNGRFAPESVEVPHLRDYANADEAG